MVDSFDRIKSALPPLISYQRARERSLLRADPPDLDSAGLHAALRGHESSPTAANAVPLNLNGETSSIRLGRRYVRFRWTVCVKGMLESTADPENVDDAQTIVTKG